MSDQDGFAILVVGSVLGLVLGLLLPMVIKGSDYDLYNIAMDECQAELPRSQKCIITAIPEVAK